MNDELLSDDERRQRAITEWWERQSLRDFIARKKAELRSRAHPLKGD